MSVSKKYNNERIDDLKQLIENIRREIAALKKRKHWLEICTCRS